MPGQHFHHTSHTLDAMHFWIFHILNATLSSILLSWSLIRKTTILLVRMDSSSSQPSSLVRRLSRTWTTAGWCWELWRTSTPTPPSSRETVRNLSWSCGPSLWRLHISKSCGARGWSQSRNRSDINLIRNQFKFQSRSWFCECIHLQVYQQYVVEHKLNKL